MTFDTAVNVANPYQLVLTDGHDVVQLDPSNSTVSASDGNRLLTYRVTDAPKVLQGGPASLVGLEVLRQEGVENAVGDWNLPVSGSLVARGTTSGKSFSRVFGGTNADLPPPPGLVDVIPIPTPDLPGPPSDYAPEVITAGCPGSQEENVYDEATGALIGRSPCNHLTPDARHDGEHGFSYIPIPGLASLEQVAATQAAQAPSTYESATAIPPEISEIRAHGKKVIVTWDQPVTCPTKDADTASEFQYGPASSPRSEDLVYAKSVTCAGPAGSGRVTAMFPSYHGRLLDAWGQPIQSGTTLRFKYDDYGPGHEVTAGTRSPYDGVRAASQSALFTAP